MAIVLDRSGSMASTKDAAIEGLNEQVQQARLRANEHDLRCSFVTFNGEVFEHLWDQPASELQEADPNDFQPMGGTAMRDAVGYTVQKLLATAGPDDGETAYLVYVISDGQTNSDLHYSVPQLKELVEGCQATKRWTFTYMGCDEAYLRLIAAQTGTPIANFAAWSNKTGRDARKALHAQAVRSKGYFEQRAAGQMASPNYANNVLGAVADFGNDAEVATSGGIVLSPVIEAPVSVDFASVLARSPKAEAHTLCATGKGLFANTYGVRWES
jgi:hypothetical protein